MCGIFGYVSEGAAASTALVDKAMGALRHRGPDDSGFTSAKNTVIGMTRLSIIDLDTGRQPIANEDGSLRIVFNGEIFNYRDLRGVLEARGHRFRTMADTEVILHGYEEYGPGILDRLNGMFAFAILDAGTGGLFAARDPLGIKPLYYCRRDEELFFGSELKTVLAMLDDSGPVDGLALSRYFSFGYIPSPQTPFANISKLPAGSCFRFDGGVLKIIPYHRLSFAEAETPQATSVKENIATTAERLEQAVNLELMSDVPLGCFLSGGVDSSAVAAMASKLAPSTLKTFCFSFAEETHDESADARLVAEHLGTDHHEISIGRDEILSALESMTDSLDEPFADSTYLTLSLLCKEVVKSVKVALTGMGGDELFTGYPTIKAHRLQRLFRMAPRVLRQGLLPPLVNALPVSDKYFSFEFKAKRFIRGQNLPQELQHFVWMENLSLAEKKTLLNGLAVENSVEETYSNVIDELGRCDAAELMNRVLYLDMRFFMENNGLFQVDRASMAHSLEARVPLLNRSLLDFAVTVPFASKYHHGQMKYLLREAARPMLPGRIFTKPKKGFGPPVSLWLRGILREPLQDAFAGSAGSVPLNYPLVRLMIDEHLSRKKDHGRALWAILVFNLWWKRYVDHE